MTITMTMAMTMTHGEGHGEGGHILEEVDRGLEDHSESHLESIFHDDDDDDDDDEPNPRID